MQAFIILKARQGFAVLVSTVLLCFVGIIFCAYMASSQLIDNQVIENYYRNNDAFANAESGINFVLGQLDDADLAQPLLSALPVVYENSDHHYRVEVRAINASRLAITSDATSADGTANRQVNLEVDFYLHYPIPVAAVSSNGKFNLSKNALINDGCEGLKSSDCLAGSHVAEYMLQSNPAIEVNESVDCSGGQVGVNVISDEALLGDSLKKEIETITAEGSEYYDWGNITIAEGSEIAGMTPDSNVDAHSLFEATFGIALNEDNLSAIGSNALSIDMTDGGDCSEQLQQVSKQDSIIFIKGDCNISQTYTLQSHTSDSKIFTIGAADDPKLVFIEGGTFTADESTMTNITGMLYFLPGTHDLIDDAGNLVDENGEPLSADEGAIEVIDGSINMGTINVNGALLSEYQCSYDGVNGNDAQQHLSIRFDKLVLETLYANLGFKAIESGYRLSAGSWRDF